MSGEYEKAISIGKAINNIVSRRYLLPAIQRKFTWSTAQIEVLFDSIMRGYPINTFMFWEVTDAKVTANLCFYQFLEKYCERFGENNPDFDTKGHGTFHAVIDGQQRLTSLYICCRQSQIDYIIRDGRRASGHLRPMLLEGVSRNIRRGAVAVERDFGATHSLGRNTLGLAQPL